MNFNTYSISEFFSPISDGPCISGKHDYLPQKSTDSWGYVDDNCNGLVLIHDSDDNGDTISYVLNFAHGMREASRVGAARVWPGGGWVRRRRPDEQQASNRASNDRRVQYVILYFNK